MPPKLDAPKGLKEEVKFHRYQLDAISWMNAIENDVDKGRLKLQTLLIHARITNYTFYPSMSCLGFFELRILFHERIVA